MKIIKKRNISKLLFGLLIFMIASTSVFAKCSGTAIKNCSSQTEDNYRCYVRTVGASKICEKSAQCASGAKMVHGKCQKVVTTKAKTTNSSKTGNTCGQTNYGAFASADECTRRGYSWDSSKKCCNTSSKRTSSDYSAGGKTAYGSFCGSSTAVSAMQKWSEKTKVSQSECNGFHNSDYLAVWSGGCCSVSKRSSSTKSSSSSSTKSSSSSSSSSVKSVAPATHTILFDQNYGYGLECDGVTSYQSDGICSGTVTAGTKVNFPASSSKMIRDGQGSLLGWSKSPECSSDSIEDYTSTYTVNSSTDFYACYIAVINGERYVQEGAVADGGEAINCGSAVKIEKCTKEEGTDYCYTDNGRKLYRGKLASTVEGANNTCASTATKSDINDYRYIIVDGEGYSCGDALHITTCTDTSCNYDEVKSSDGTSTKATGTVERMSLNTDESTAKAACSKVSETAKKCNNNTLSNRRGTSSYTLCYNENADMTKIKAELEKYYSCDTKNGYYFDTTSVVSKSAEDCNSNGICTRTYSVSCTNGSKAKPVLAVTSGLVQSNGYGTITVEGKTSEGTITSYYVSDYYVAPTNKSNWTTTNSNTFTITSSPGVKYIWVRDSKGNISNSVTGAVIDTVNTNTTINKLELYDENGEIQTTSSVSYNTDTIKSDKYVRLSNDLSKDSNALADGFNPFDTEYKLEVDSETLTVYATLTSTDSKYVEGFEPRTVNLNYGVNTILIKIENNEGVIRTYTILATRVDNRTSDNTLSDLSVSVGDIEFNANVTDYKIEIPKDTEFVGVNATLSSDSASFVEGYEPGTVEITGDTTVGLVKVKSETGSTRTYVLSFIKEGTDEISKKSLQLKDLVIPTVNIPFESDVSNYSLSVDYQVDTIDVNTTLEDEDSSVLIRSKRKGETDYVVNTNKGIDLEVGENFIEIEVTDKDGFTSYYRLTIIRKEFGLDISDETALKELRVLGYDIKFVPNKKDYTVRIKQEKTLVITAIPANNRAEVFIRGNDELTGFSTVRVKVVAENGKYDTYSIDIKKDPFNKTIENLAIVAGVVIILLSSGIIIMKKRHRAKKEYFEE